MDAHVVSGRLDFFLLNTEGSSNPSSLTSETLSCNPNYFVTGVGVSKSSVDDISISSSGVSKIKI